MKREAPLQTNASAGMMMRPQTAQVRMSTPLDQIDDVDSELSEMLANNQRRLQQLHSEFKVVSKMAEEPYINVRKIKTTSSRP